MKPEFLQLPQQREPWLKPLCGLWQRSVENTHDFLTAQGMEELLPQVTQGLAHVPTLVVAQVGGRLAGFMGIQGENLAMLFLDPAYFGRGLGKAMLRRAIDQYGVATLEVNEQNPGALGFYQHMGFVVVERCPWMTGAGPTQFCAWHTSRRMKNRTVEKPDQCLPWGSVGNKKRVLEIIYNKNDVELCAAGHHRAVFTIMIPLKLPLKPA